MLVPGFASLHGAIAPSFAPIHAREICERASEGE